MKREVAAEIVDSLKEAGVDFVATLTEANLHDLVIALGAAVGASLANEPIATFFGYRIREIAAHLGVHYSTVSRRLNEMEQEE